MLPASDRATALAYGTRMTTRRGFIAAAAVTAAFGGYAIRAGAQRGVDETYRNEVYGYGPLREDPHGIFDLPEGFSYRIVSRAGETMDDGLYVPGKTDGMACFPLDGSRVVLVRNHELWPSNIERGPAGPELRMIDKIDRMKAYDLDLEGRPLPGGTTTIVYDLAARRRVTQHLRLTGADRTACGGPTPAAPALAFAEAVQQPRGRPHDDHGGVA